MGDPQPSEELGEALEGNIEAELISGSTESDNKALLERYGSLLEVYVPIRDTTAAAGSDPAGVFELYLPYAQVQAAIRADQRRAFLVVGVGLLVLWLGLFRTVATASRQLRRHSERTDYEAAHDGLTQLPNRSLLLARIELALLEAQPRCLAAPRHRPVPRGQRHARALARRRAHRGGGPPPRRSSQPMATPSRASAETSSRC